MNNNYIFGIGILLAVLLVFTAPAMAGPNTVYFEPQHSSADPDGIVDVVLWFNLTDAYGIHPEYGFSILAVNFTWNPDVLDVISCDRPDVDPWDAGWTVRNYGDSWYVLAEHDPWNVPEYGLAPGVYPVANFTLQGIDPGTTDLAFVYTSAVSPRFCEMVDAIGDLYPEQVWEEGMFTCVGDAETFTKPLALGWNLVSLPLTPDDNSTSTVLTSITGNYGAVKSYNASTNQFEDANTMDPGVGYFVHVTTAGTWSYDGQPCNSISASLSQGLNMVGWTNTSAALPGALSSTGGNYRYVAHWNATSQSYEVYLPGAPAVFNDFDTMERGEGYFIAATAECALTYP